MKKYLQLCVEVEETAAQIYRQMSLSKNLPGALKVVLHNLADDEDAHAAQLRLAQRFPAGTAIVGPSFDFAIIQALLQQAKDLLEKTSQSDFDIKQVIEAGILLEKDFCKTHIANSLKLKDENLKKMFAAMARDDETHRQKLRDAKLRFL